MRSLIIIWLLVLVTLVGGSLYMNHVIGQMLVETQTSVLTPRTSLEVHSANSTQLQPAGMSYEDEYTPVMAVQPADYSKQTTRHYYFLQPTEWQYGVTYDPQLSEDVTLTR